MPALGTRHAVKGPGQPKEAVGKAFTAPSGGGAGLTAGPPALIQPCVSRPEGRPEPSLQVLLGEKKKFRLKVKPRMLDSLSSNSDRGYYLYSVSTPPLVFLWY